MGICGSKEKQQNLLKSQTRSNSKESPKKELATPGLTKNKSFNFQAPQFSSKESLAQLSIALEQKSNELDKQLKDAIIKLKECSSKFTKDSTPYKFLAGKATSKFTIYKNLQKKRAYIEKTLEKQTNRELLDELGENGRFSPSLLAKQIDKMVIATNAVKEDTQTILDFEQDYKDLVKTLDDDQDNDGDLYKELDKMEAELKKAGKGNTNSDDEIELELIALEFNVISEQPKPKKEPASGKKNSKKAAATFTD